MIGSIGVSTKLVKRKYVSPRLQSWLKKKNDVILFMSIHHSVKKASKHFRISEQQIYKMINYQIK